MEDKIGVDLEAPRLTANNDLGRVQQKTTHKAKQRNNMPSYNISIALQGNTQ